MEVVHAYCESLSATPGDLSSKASDPATLKILGVSIGRKSEKINLFRRYRDELAYGRQISKIVSRSRPRVVITSTSPIIADKMLYAACDKIGAKKIYWLQDLAGKAAKEILREKYGALGELFGEYIRKQELKLLNESDAVISIGDDFNEYLHEEVGLSRQDVHIVPNWAPTDALREGPKENVWSQANGLFGHTVVLYAGTLGLKNSPALLLALARRLQIRARDEMLVVVSTGAGVGWLEEHKTRENLSNLKMLPWQPFDALALMLSSADVLVGSLNSKATGYSVPSKVLSYMCCGRPIVLAASVENSASKMLQTSGAGLVCMPGDEKAFVEAVEKLLDNKQLAQEMGKNGQYFAQREFDIEVKKKEFMAVIQSTTYNQVQHKIYPERSNT